MSSFVPLPALNVLRMDNAVEDVREHMSLLFAFGQYLFRSDVGGSSPRLCERVVSFFLRGPLPGAHVSSLGVFKAIQLARW